MLERWFHLRRSLSGRPRPARSGIQLNREDTERIDQLARSVRRVRVSRSLLGIAWTAGPVTGLGLYGGYFIAYGQAPTTQQLIYFITFTVCSGLLGLIAKVVYDSVWGYTSERAQRHVDEAIDKLGDLVLSSRDLLIQTMDGETREREAALQLLMRVNLPTSAVISATTSITGNKSLGRVLAKIDSYRRAGLFSRISDMHHQYDELFTTVISEQELSPQLLESLKMRYSGDIARLRHGVPRTEHFISRVLAAIEQDNLLLITMQDVESMLVLAFELISGREIPLLIFDYRGRWRLAKALDRMERKRSRYRIAQAAASNRIRGLASWLVEVNALGYEDVPEGIGAGLLSERVGDTIDQLADELFVYVDKAENGDWSAWEALKQKAGHMTNALSLYREALESYRRIGEYHAEFLEAAQNWNTLLTELKPDMEELKIGPRGRGIHIREKVIALDEDERKEVATHLARYMRSQHLETHENKNLFERRSVQDNPLTFDAARQLAIEVALALEPYVHLSLPEVQRGIGATLASYLGDLEPGMSAGEKRRLGEAMANDVEEDTGKAAEHLAVALVRHYRVNLSETACQFLFQTYGARQSVLDILSQYQADEAGPQQSLLTVRPPNLPNPQRRWYRALARARRLIEQVNSSGGY